MNRTAQTERFDDLLDALFEPVPIVGGGELPYSEVLRRCDPIAYRCAFIDWLDIEEEEEED